MDLRNALRLLFPAAVPGVDYDLVQEADDPAPRIGAWRLADPQPDAAALAAASDAYDAAQTTQRSRVRTALQSTVGVDILALTSGQQRALLAALLWQVGAIASDGTIRPLKEWMEL